MTKVGGAPMRNSTLRDADDGAQVPRVHHLRQRSKYSDPDWRPIIPVWDEINVQALGVGVSEALTGKKSPEEALNGMVPQVTDIMKRGRLQGLSAWPTATRRMRTPRWVPALSTSAPPCW